MIYKRHLLLFTKTTGYRHASLNDGVRLITDQAYEDGNTLDHSEDSTLFTLENLARYDAVIWLQVTGNVLDEAGRRAFSAYLNAGGGFAGIHVTADAERSWPAYEDIVGARFAHHPRSPNQLASLAVEAAHPSTDHLSNPWLWADEWYAFERNPRGCKEVVLSVDETTYDPEFSHMGDDHPISWWGQWGKGRTWYTSLGHHSIAYSNPVFRAHIRGGVASVLPPRPAVENKPGHGFSPVNNELG